jgi:hypothetical protein
LQNHTEAGHWWFTPLILAIQETEIRRQRLVWETLSQKYPSQKELVEWLKV